MFENLKNALAAEREAREESTRFYIVNGYFPAWAEDNRRNPDEGLQRHSTPAKWEAYKAGTLSRADAIRIATRRAFKEIEKTYAVKLTHLDRISNAPNLEFITINVEWRPSRAWGHNPHVDAVTNEAEVYTGNASGCGYDKASAALAEALNASPAVLKMLYTAAENALAAGQTFTRYNNGNVTWRDVLGYGSGYNILPYFEGGVGVSCFETIFNHCGYTFRQVASSKYFEAYNVQRKGAA
jgi:hypothetical protein